jgi:hypothetical protein
MGWDVTGYSRDAWSERSGIVAISIDEPLASVSPPIDSLGESNAPLAWQTATHTRVAGELTQSEGSVLTILLENGL